ncbi:MAG: HAMP domain-containing protein [Candidatus Staskawiczbacteria bacterium]|jgi:nitrate/nitrite-specific signal transduction histidine kinase
MTIKSRIVYKIAAPIIIVGIFVISILVALNYENLTIQVYAIFGLTAIFVFLFGFATGQSFSSPLRQLLERAQRLSQGDFTPGSYLETKDEFEELAKIFNKIAEELNKSHEMAEKAGDVADVKIRAKTQELEEEVSSLEQKVKMRAQELQRMIGESEKLQELAKMRGAEIVQLKKELQGMEEKPVKRPVQKKESAPEV